MSHTSRRPRAAVLASVVLLLAACSSDAKPSVAGSSASSSAAPSGPVYAKEGPYKVGYTTLHLPDRDVAVWYPADASAVAGKPKATYEQTTPLPDNLKAVIPAQFNRAVTMNAYADVPASTDGPFPVVLFSHGLSAYPLVTSALTVGMASWGFVVVAPDYIERGIVSQITHPGAAVSFDAIDAGAARDTQTTFDALELVTQENGRSGSPLYRTLDTSRVAAVGHSAGGNTAFNVLADPRISAAVGWAPVPPNTPPPNKPTMIIGAGQDIVLTPATLSKEYASFQAPKRYVEIGGSRAGHNTFTDACAVIRDGGGLLEYARQQHFVNDALIAFGENGCAPTDLPPDRFQSLVQHFTVAELRDVFGIDPQPVGLDDGAVGAFGDIPVKYQHEP